ncbi:MAG TPA: endolytic transglycosylase MltG [Candidatus Acidoferrum sp.]|nr:endolytic transglycosylase MltG [Candidatus Acidoferrum sp.]
MRRAAKLLPLVLLLAIAGGMAEYARISIEKPYRGFGPGGVFVTVPHGASSRAVSHILAREGVVRSAWAFELYARRHAKRTLQAGEYFFDTAVSGKDVFWTIANGKIYEKAFTVREGETMFEIAHELEAGNFMSAEDFLQAASNPELIRDIAPDAKTLEGFLYPATYHLPRHPVPVELTSLMVQKFKEEWGQIADPGPDQTGLTNGQPVLSVVTLASLVERETPKQDERYLVAGVFENRLRKGMLLQCDPTVIYALEQTGSYDGTLTGKDLHVDSPYNTYEHRGLPPGPIGNPGAVSLRAALEPAQTGYLYFVANTEGGHFFSDTLQEHNKNVVRYHRLLAGLPADPPPKPEARKKPHAKRHKKAGR